jgi:hypothetical protein
MMVHFHSVERHFWWKAGSEHREEFKQVQGVVDDVMIGFVGYMERDKSLLRSHDVNKRSRMVVAPAGGSEGFRSGQVAKEFFLQHSSPEDWVGDIFCGSGEGAIAAAACGRSSISVDMMQEKASVHLFCSVLLDFVVIYLCLLAQGIHYSHEEIGGPAEGLAWERG